MWYSFPNGWKECAGCGKQTQKRAAACFPAPEFRLNSKLEKEGICIIWRCHKGQHSGQRAVSAHIFESVTAGISGRLQSCMCQTFLGTGDGPLQLLLNSRYIYQKVWPFWMQIENYNCKWPNATERNFEQLQLYGRSRGEIFLRELARPENMVTHGISMSWHCPIRTDIGICKFTYSTLERETSWLEM